MKKTLLLICLLIVPFIAKAKKASAVWYIMAPSSQFEIEDNNLSIEYDIYTHSANESYGLGPNPYMRITFTNKSDNVIYVDLASSFLLRNDNATALYVPSATSVTTGQSIGVGVNAGAVAGALGVGGFVGDVLNGVNVGGNRSSQTTSIVYAQRITVIPPHSSYILEDVQILSPGAEKAIPGRFYFKEVGMGKQKRLWCLSYKYEDLQSGDLLNFTEETSPFTIGAYITYSFSEDFNETKGMKSNFYVAKIIGSSVSTFPLTANKEFNIVDKVFPEWRETTYYEIIRLWAK